MTNGAVKPLPDLTDELRERIVDTVSETLQRVYIFPEASKAMSEHVQSRLHDGAYAEIDEFSTFTRQLTQDLLSIHEDRHVAVFPWRPPADAAESLSQAEETENQIYGDMERANFGFRKVEILSGNIGYIDLRMFYPADRGAPTAVAAMSLLAHTDGLIFDLRDNGGGCPTMVQFLASYLFDELKHLCTTLHLGEGRIEQHWTLPYVEGPCLSHLPVYVLTSRSTFSAAEDFTYNLQQLERVTVVGERSRGGAHPVDLFRFKDLSCQLLSPIARSMNPITNDNWEGTGVIPNIESPADGALDRALVDLFERLTESSEDPEKRRRWAWGLAKVKARQEPVPVEPRDWDALAGDYGTVHIEHTSRGLALSWDNRRTYTLTPMTERIFEFNDGTERVEFVWEDGVVARAIFRSESGEEYNLPASAN